jgi:hypothetical protein
MIDQGAGLAFFLAGLADLIMSVGIAWVLARLSRDGPVDGARTITIVIFVMLFLGVVLCVIGLSPFVSTFITINW